MAVVSRIASSMLLVVVTATADKGKAWYTRRYSYFAGAKCLKQSKQLLGVPRHAVRIPRPMNGFTGDIPKAPNTSF